MRLAAWLGLGQGHARRTSLRVALLVNTVLPLVLVLALAGLALGAAIGWYYASVGWDDAMPAGLVDAAGQPAKYTLVFMSQAARRRTLRLAVEHYSKCPSGETSGRRGFWIRLPFASTARALWHSCCRGLRTGWPPPTWLRACSNRLCARSGGGCGCLERRTPTGRGV